ncbi:MAG: hypothetical protein NUW14_10830, partial [Deltaproteobacteria bacterium]|nr:hypothetical protein [Deltaproteobacteria bacterium]
CPPVCHKCHAEMKYGAVFAEGLRFHHPECGKAKLHNPDVAVATALDVQGADPYARRAESALDPRAVEFILEDATEAFARIEEECGLTRSVGRKDQSTYAGAQALPKKTRKAVLAAVKKFSKNAWNRMEVLLQDIDATKLVLDAMKEKEQAERNRIQRERWERDRAEKGRLESERIAKVLAGEPQPYDDMLRVALTQEEGALESWDEARSQGLNHYALRTLIIDTLFPGGIGGGLNMPGQTSVSWKGGPPRVWVGPATGKPTLEDNALVDAVRRIMQIPDEKEEPEEGVVDPERQPDDGEEEAP